MIREIKPEKEFLPFPAYAERRRWDSLPLNIKNSFISEAEQIRGREWPVLTAALYLDYYRNGNRSRYEARTFGRRHNLFTLLMAECIEGGGRFIDEIINGVWLMCEETSWVVPAHINGLPGKPRVELPDVEETIIIDLFSAETGSLFSWIYYFLGDAIAARSPLVKRRMEVEMIKRIFKPFLEQLCKLCGCRFNMSF